MPDLVNKRRISILAAVLFVGLTVISLALAARPQMAFSQPGTSISGKNNSLSTANETAAGTLNLHKAAVDFLNQSLNTTLSDALETAEKQVANGTAIEAHLDAVESYLVYNITVADLTNELFYRVSVDAGSGKVLTISPMGEPLFTLGAKGNTENYVNVNASLEDAANAAEGQIQNGAAIAGRFELVPGLRNPVYNITVFGLDTGLFFKVYVDTATAKVLYLPEEMNLGELHVRGVF